MWKLDDKPIPTEFGDFSILEAVAGRWELRKGQRRIQMILGLAVQTEDGVEVSSQDWTSGRPEEIEFPIVEAPLELADDGTDPELTQLFDDYQDCLSALMEKGLRLMGKNIPGLDQQTFMAWGYRRKFKFTHVPRDRKKDRARVAHTVREGESPPQTAGDRVRAEHAERDRKRQERLANDLEPIFTPPYAKSEEKK